MNEMTFNEVAKVLEQTIKKDEETSKILFAAGLLTYTDEDQINIAMEGVSSVGKTHNCREVFSLFGGNPAVLTFADMSPTAFYYRGTPDPNDKTVRVHNLERKIVIFLDQPDYRILEKMRPLMSHDDKVLTWEVTDKHQKVLKCKVLGYPTIIFCTTPSVPDLQEKTRMLYVSPSEDPAKIKEALKFQTLKAEDWNFVDKILDNPPRKELKQRIEAIKNANIKKVNIPNADRALDWFSKKFGNNQPRHMRDYPRFLALIKANAILNFELRKFVTGTLEANEPDIEEGIRLFEPISECNTIGLSPHQFRVWKEVLEPLLSKNDEVDFSTFRQEYYHKFHSPLTPKQSSLYVQSFVDTSLCLTRKSDVDGRKTVIVSIDDASVGMQAIQQRLGGGKQE